MESPLPHPGRASLKVNRNNMNPNESWGFWTLISSWFHWNIEAFSLSDLHLSVQRLFWKSTYWNAILEATADAINLKLYAPNIPQTIVIFMAQYFWNINNHFSIWFLAFYPLMLLNKDFLDSGNIKLSVKYGHVTWLDVALAWDSLCFILADRIKSGAGVVQFLDVQTCSSSQSNRGWPADTPLIELAVITGVAAGFPGIYSSTEHALPQSGFHTYIHPDSHMHTLADRHAHTHANAAGATCLSVSWVLKMHVSCLGCLRRRMQNAVGQAY